MPRVLTIIRSLVIIPIFGLAITAGLMFVYGGIELLRFLLAIIAEMVGFSASTHTADSELLVFQLLTYVHTFLVGTVIFITALGMYQLFIRELALPGWLKIDSTEELETNLIGVTVVVLAVEFMGEVLTGHTKDVLALGAGLALPIMALALFVGLRAVASRLGTKPHHSELYPSRSADTEAPAHAKSAQE